MVGDLFTAIEDLDVTPDEFWAAMNYLTSVGQRSEWGLLAAGLGFEHFLDLRMDEAEQEAGVLGGTPRTIEGPLYVAGSPLEQGSARLDDGEDPGEVLIMHGRVLETDGSLVPGAVVHV